MAFVFSHRISLFKSDIIKNRGDHKWQIEDLDGIAEK